MSVALCGLSGYRQFLPASWVSRLLEMSGDRPCFGQRDPAQPCSHNVTEALVPPASQEYRAFEREQRRLREERGGEMGGVVVNGRRIKRGRVKRSDKTLPGGCSAHMTGLVVAVMSEYLAFTAYSDHIMVDMFM